MEAEYIYRISLLILALLFGSFTNVLIHRIPRKISIIEPGSQCIECHHQLKFWENIPLFSYILLLGKCSKCKTPISIQYPIVEVLVLLLASPFALGPINFSHYIFCLITISLTTALAFIDYHHKELPLKLSYALITLSLFFQMIYGNSRYEILDNFKSLPTSLGYLCSGLVFLGITFFFLDSFTHFANKFYFKDQALRVSPIALGLRVKFLHRHIEWVYFLIYLAISFAMISQIEIINYLFLVIGSSYFGHEVLLEFLFVEENREEDLSSQKLKTIFGGGDTAMLGFITIILGLKTGFIVLLSSFYIGFIFLISKRIYEKLQDKSRTALSFKNEYIVLGPALAIAFITAMIFF